MNEFSFSFFFSALINTGANTLWKLVFAAILGYILDRVFYEDLHHGNPHLIQLGMHLDERLAQHAAGWAPCSTDFEQYRLAFVCVKIANLALVILQRKLWCRLAGQYSRPDSVRSNEKEQGQEKPR